MPSMKQAPSVWTISALTQHLKKGPQVGIGGSWYPARPLGLFSVKARILLAWEVFTGEADVLRWPGNQ